MPFEQFGPTPRRIAVIGGGISGMAAAHLLADRNSVVLFEAEPRLGGHARTVIAGKRKDQPVDTGFIVFNHVNYPHLVRLFDKLGVPTTESTMSFDGGQAFTVAGAPIARDAAVVEAGVDVALTRTITAGFSYSGQFGDGDHDHAGVLTLRWKY